MLRAPAIYFPASRGVYDVAPGLKPLGFDFGNGSVDGKIFQIDRDFGAYHAAKLEARAERLGKYVIERGLPDPARVAVATFIAERLAAENPDFFAFRRGGRGEIELDCALTGERLEIDGAGNLLGAERLEAPRRTDEGPACNSALDALGCQIQEDLAIVGVGENSSRLAALHLCFPSHWSAEEKIGGDFNAIHAPVAGFEKIAKTSGALLRAVMEKGPYVRFAWSLTADTRLNHHPDPSPGVDRASWDGRGFGEVANAAGLFMRIERQCLVGFPQADCFLFTIRVYHRSCESLAPGERGMLRSALASMTAESRRYKGVDENFEHLAAILAD